ncbi:MAG TPA: hypothetical protein V6C97_19725 [Oculatellaceae cyanobacterium]
MTSSVRSGRLSPLFFSAPEDRPVLGPQWILSRRMDLLFICGGLLWIIFFVFYPFTFGFYQKDSLTTLITFAGALLFADAHNAATILRLIEEPGLAKSHPIVSFALPCAFALTGVALLCHNSLLSPAITLYLILVAQHATAQAYGITMIYLRKSGLTLSSWQVRLVRWTFHSMMIAAIVHQFSPGAPVRSMGIDTVYYPLFDLTTPVVVDALAVVVACTMFGVLMYECRKAKVELHPGAAILTLSTLAVFTLGQAHQLALALAPAFLHGSQYLAVTTSLYLKQLKDDPSCTASGKFEELAAHYGKLLSIGLALYFVLPYGITRLGFSNVEALAVVFLMVNFHHFIADAVIWKMRPNTQQKLLLT